MLKKFVLLYFTGNAEPTGSLKLDAITVQPAKF